MRPEEKEAFQKQCELLQANLIAAMQNAVGILSDQPATSFAIRNFNDQLNPNSDHFKRQITSYIRDYLVNEFETTEAFEAIFSPAFPKSNDDSEIANLFRHPKNVMGAAYEQVSHFGLAIYDQFYNFDEQLKLIFKINFLYSACLHENFEADWIKKQYDLLETKVTEFTLLTQNEDGLKKALKTRLPASSHFKKLADVFVGKKTIYFLKQCYAALQMFGLAIHYIVINHYQGGYQLGYSLALFQIVDGFLTAALSKLPLFIVQSIVGLPIRLIRAAINLVTKEDSVTRANTNFILSKINGITDNILNYTLGLGLWLMTTGVNYVVAIVSSFIIYPVIMGFARLVIKPIISKLTPHPDQQPQMLGLLTKLQFSVQQTLLASPKHQNISIHGNTLTLTDLTNEIFMLRKGQKSSTLDWLKAIALKQDSFIISFHDETNSSCVHHVIIGKENNIESICQLIDNETTTSLTVDWRYYNPQQKPSVEEINTIANQLEKRKAPLKNLCFATCGMDDKDIQKISQTLMNNPALQLETLSIPTTNLSLESLKVLLELVQKNESIKNIPSLTNDGNAVSNPQQAARKAIHAILVKRRDGNTSNVELATTTTRETSPPSSLRNSSNSILPFNSDSTDMQFARTLQRHLR